MSADAMVEAVRLPEPLHDDSALFPAYVDHEYNMRDQYRGSVARFQEGTADLDPPTDKEIGKTFIELAGGMNSEPPRVFQRLFCFESGRQVGLGDLLIVRFLFLGRRHVADRFRPCSTAGCSSQGPGDNRQKPMQVCLAAAKTKSEKNDCYYCHGHGPTMSAPSS